MWTKISMKQLGIWEAFGKLIRSEVFPFYLLRKYIFLMKYYINTFQTIYITIINNLWGKSFPKGWGADFAKFIRSCITPKKIQSPKSYWEKLRILWIYWRPSPTPSCLPKFLFLFSFPTPFYFTPIALLIFFDFVSG